MDLLDLAARYPGWQIWTVTRYPNGLSWSARPWPRLELDSLDQLVAEILRAHEAAAGYWPALAPLDRMPRHPVVPHTAGVRGLTELDKLRGEIRDALPGWDILYSPRRDTDPVWTAQPYPLLHAAAAAEMAEWIEAAHGGGEWPALAFWPAYQQAIGTVQPEAR